MPFDSARSLDFEQTEEPDLAALGTAVAEFDLPHPYLLFHKEALSEVRRLAATNEQLTRHSAKLLSEVAPPPTPSDPRAVIKRRARRLINTAFIALTAEPALAEAALSATRDTLGQFAAAPTWKERPVIRSFLDCAEIAIAVALAYDWLYDALPASERQRDRSLDPAQCFDAGAWPHTATLRSSGRDGGTTARWSRMPAFLSPHFPYYRLTAHQPPNSSATA